MKRLSIEAFEDHASAGGGYAVLLLRGLDRMPTPARFRLHVIDALPLGDGVRRLSAGDLEPTQIRSTKDGIELVLGPQITTCPLLLPGTAVEIEIPAAAARGGFLWPAVTPAQAASGRFGMFRRDTSETAARSVMPTSTIVLPSPPVAASGHKAVAARSGNGHDAVFGNANAVVGPYASHDIGAPAGTVSAALSAAAATTDADTLAVAPRQVNATTIRWQPTNGRAHDTPASSFGSSPPVRHRSAWRARGMFLAAVAATVLAIEVALVMLPGGRLLTIGRERASHALTQEPADLTAILVLDWLRAGGQSPRGVAVAGVTAEQALERANTYLLATGPGRRDTDEGRFWLKHYLSATAGETTTTRALTQLGSAYAEPSRGAPDYERARLIWQTSAALGDPLAMCFLGRLFTKGLGVAADPVIGANWLERARRAGGCGGSEAAHVR
ncbi:MAG: tetratricopeptide repeat protein [Hyphomicrobiaceae bacterium]